MHFKLLIVLVEDAKTDAVIEAARDAGATGTTVISNASGDGIEKSQTFFGLTLETQRDVLLLLVEEHLSRHILERISEAGEFDTQSGAGIAFQIDVEDVVGITHQMEALTEKVEEKL
ncbi:MAG: hypothetical protein L3J46_11590 [Kangiellaceae bacterium]|nr:hypothetical protein [Kangiellaceae bacterium]